MRTMRVPVPLDVDNHGCRVHAGTRVTKHQSATPVLIGLVAMLLLAGVPALAQANPEATVPDLAGTYSVMMCRGPCSGDAGQVLAEGILVLEAQPYSVTEVPERARTYFERFTTLLLHAEAEDAPNACFVLDRKRSGSLAGVTAVGLTKWRSESGDTLAVQLYRSADAGYNARLSISSDGLVGRGESWGPWDESENPPLDYIVARRIAPADRDQCFRTAEHRLTQLHR